MSLIFVRSSITTSQFAGRHRKHGSSLDESEHDVNLGNVIVELFHKIFGDEVSKTDLILGILDYRGQNVVEHGVAVLQDVGRKLEEN